MVVTNTCEHANSFIDTQTHTHTDTHTQTHRHTDTQTHRHTDTHTYTHTHALTRIHTHTHIHQFLKEAEIRQPWVVNGHNAHTPDSREACQALRFTTT